MCPCSGFYWKLPTAPVQKKKKKKLLSTCFKVYTSIRKPLLLCSQAPRHLVIKSFLYHWLRYVFSFIKVQRFILPLTERKNNMESRELLHFSICSHCSKEKMWPFRTVEELCPS